MQTKTKCLFIILICLCSIYPIYTNVLYGIGETTYQNHLDWLNNKSLFYNPWQYRILSPLSVELINYILDNTLYKILFLIYTPHSINTNQVIHSPNGFFLAMLSDKATMTYTLTFAIIRFLQHLIIFGLWGLLLRPFLKNQMWFYLAIPFLSLSFANAVFNSDFALSVYFEIIFYLLACYICLYKKSYLYLLFVIFLAGLNRETSVLIPFFVFFLNDKKIQPNWDLKESLLNRQNIFKLLIGLLVFIIAFLMPRLYFGWVKPSEGHSIALFHNLMSLNTIYVGLNLFGTVTLTPFIALWWLKKTDLFFKFLFWLITPFWIILHFSLSAAEESRLFLVPYVLVWLPITLFFLDKLYLRDFE